MRLGDDDGSRILAERSLTTRVLKTVVFVAITSFQFSINRIVVRRINELYFFFTGRNADILDTTNPDWAPCVNLGHENIKNVSLAVARNDRCQKRNEKKRKYTAMAAANSTEDSCDVASFQTSADSGASGSGKCTPN